MHYGLGFWGLQGFGAGLGGLRFRAYAGHVGALIITYTILGVPYYN